MLNENEMKAALSLKRRIVEKQAQARLYDKLRQQVRSSGQDPKGHAQKRFRDSKAAVGRETRVLLLAYGFIRGVPYEKMEPRSKSEVSPRHVRQTLQEAFTIEKLVVIRKAELAPDFAAWSDEKVRIALGRSQGSVQTVSNASEEVSS